MNCSDVQNGIFFVNFEYWQSNIYDLLINVHRIAKEMSKFFPYFEILVNVVLRFTSICCCLHELLSTFSGNYLRR